MTTETVTGKATTSQASGGEKSTMTPEAAWDAAMAYENRHDPYPFFDELRKTPVVHVGGGLYVVTGYRELLTLAHDPRISSDTRRLKALRDGKDEANVSAYGEHGTMINSDPPEHDKMRRQAMRHFGPPHSPHVIPDMEPLIQKLCHDSLDKIKASGKKRFDVVDDYGYPVPVAVICKLLGVPVEDEHKFHIWVHDFMAGIMDVGPESKTEEGKARHARGVTSSAAFAKYNADLIQGYLKKPADCMFSKLVNEDGPDGPMSVREANINANLLLIAGHDSTVNTISNCVMCTLRTPGCLELLQSRPDLIPAAIEEALRMQASVQFFPSRSAIEDVAINGTVIPKGSPVFLMYGAANRDPLRFPNPNTFDPERQDNQHFGWGSGIHTCFGGPLARLEVNIAFETFLRRVENPRLVVDPPPYRQSNVFRGPEHLVVDCDRIKD